MRVKHLYNVDINLIIFVYFVVATLYSNHHHLEYFLTILLLWAVAVKEKKRHVAGFEWKATIRVFQIFVKAGRHIETCLISVELDFSPGFPH